MIGKYPPSKIVVDGRFDQAYVPPPLRDACSKLTFVAIEAKVHPVPDTRQFPA